MKILSTLTSSLFVAGSLMAETTTINAPLSDKNWSWIESSAPYYVIPSCDPSEDYPCAVDHDGNFDTTDFANKGSGYKHYLANTVANKTPQVYVDLFTATDDKIVALIPVFFPFQPMGAHLNNTTSSPMVFVLAQNQNPFVGENSIADIGAELAFAGGNWNARFLSAATSKYMAQLNADVSDKVRMGNGLVNRNISSLIPAYDNSNRSLDYVVAEATTAGSSSRVIFLRDQENGRTAPVTNVNGMIEDLNSESTHVLVPPGAGIIPGFDKVTYVNYTLIKPEFATVVVGNQEAATKNGARGFMASNSTLQTRDLTDATGVTIKTRNVYRDMVNEKGEKGKGNIPAAWRPKDDPVAGNTSPESHLAHIDMWLKMFPGFMSGDIKMIRNMYYEAVAE